MILLNPMSLLRSTRERLETTLLPTLLPTLLRGSAPLPTLLPTLLRLPIQPPREATPPQQRLRTQPLMLRLRLKVA